jgi:hypothetical protein
MVGTFPSDLGLSGRDHALHRSAIFSAVPKNLIVLG